MSQSHAHSPTTPLLPDRSAYYRSRVLQEYGRKLWSFERFRALVRKLGLSALARRIGLYPRMPWMLFVCSPIAAGCRRLTRQSRFTVGSLELPYAPWWVNGERRVELPLAEEFERTYGYGSLRTLEVGNSVGATPRPNRVVVDKYEPAHGVQRADVESFLPGAAFDAILSISTLEHVGFDEVPEDLGKFERSFRHLFEVCLRPGGVMLITLPLGYNPEVDRILLSGHLGLGEVSILKHKGTIGTWGQIPLDSVVTGGPPLYRYDLHRAEAVAVWFVRKLVT